MARAGTGRPRGALGLRRWLGIVIVLAGLVSAGRLGEVRAATVQKAANGGPAIWLMATGDFAKQFDDDAALGRDTPKWRGAASRIRVMKFSTQFFKAVPDVTLARIVRTLAAKKIALGIEGLVQNWYGETPVCGQGVEGYSDPATAEAIVAKITKARGKLAYLAMDEPLHFGHYYGGKNACHSPIANVAERVAVILKIYRRAFPDIVVGDIEPFPAVSARPGWAADYAAWAKAFRTATGMPLAFLHIDLDWDRPFLLAPGPERHADPQAVAKLIEEIAAVARANGVKVGVILNSAVSARTDAAWMDQARNHADILKAMPTPIDHLIVQSWNPNPHRMLPDSDGQALTSLIPYWSKPAR